jgi:hypothetical protein
MSKEKALRQARLVALALLAGQVIFLAAAVLLVTMGAVAPGPADLSQPLAAACVVVFAVLVPLAFILRRRLFEPREQGAAPEPANLLKAHIIFFALCEMVTLLCLVATLVHGALAPGAILALLSMGVQATNVPRVEDAA